MAYHLHVKSGCLKGADSFYPRTSYIILVESDVLSLSCPSWRYVVVHFIGE